MAKKSKKKSKSAKTPLLALAGGVVGNLLAQAVTDGVSAYLDNGHGKGKKKSKSIRKVIQKAISQRSS